MTGDCYELDGLVCEDHLDERLLDAFVRGFKAVALLALPAAAAALAATLRNYRRCTALRRTT